MIHKTLEDHLSEQRELYKQYTATVDRKLIELCANKIKELIEKEGETHDK